MHQINTKVKNIHGIHCRPSSAIVKEAKNYESSITVNANNEEAELSSILDLISLGLQPGAEVCISAEGNDEVLACEAIAKLFEAEFDYPDK